MRAVLAGLAACLLTGTLASSAASDEGLMLAPTGPQHVGVSPLLHVIYGPGRREVPLQVWYPASHPGPRRPPYMPPQLLELYPHYTGIRTEQFRSLRGTATNGARWTTGRHPVLILWPGTGHPFQWLTGLAEELASRGYVVLGLDDLHNTIFDYLASGKLAGAMARPS